MLVVDDDSPDGTGAIAEGLAARSPSVHVIRRRGERGLGTAYLAGFREAIRQGGEHLLTMDCDFSHDPAAIPALLAAAESADLVIGSRYVPGGTIQGWPPHRRLISKAANLRECASRSCRSASAIGSTAGASSAGARRCGGLGT